MKLMEKVLGSLMIRNKIRAMTCKHTKTSAAWTPLSGPKVFVSVKCSYCKKVYDGLLNQLDTPKWAQNAVDTKRKVQVLLLS